MASFLTLGSAKPAIDIVSYGCVAGGLAAAQGGAVLGAAGAAALGAGAAAVGGLLPWPLRGRPGRLLLGA
ncbi:hypothetical protein WJX81_002153 [Elliptochloris bilobata]|uniref:Uncharacterized protein n=1 Tax=Elliptochloris bilobata TaxID=381761 RepID=A0AAW1RSH3_9CHLO